MKRLVLLFVFALSLPLQAGTISVDSLTWDRTVSASIADDHCAALGFEDCTAQESSIGSASPQRSFHWDTSQAVVGSTFVQSSGFAGESVNPWHNNGVQVLFTRNATHYNWPEVSVGEFDATSSVVAKSEAIVTTDTFFNLFELRFHGGEDGTTTVSVFDDATDLLLFQSDTPDEYPTGNWQTIDVAETVNRLRIEVASDILLDETVGFQQPLGQRRDFHVQEVQVNVTTPEPASGLGLLVMAFTGLLSRRR